MKTAVSKVWTGSCWVDTMLKTHAKVVEYKDGKSVYDILKPLEPYITGTIQQPFTVQNPRAVNKTTVASDGIHIGTETSEVHYGKGFIVDKYGEAETVYGLPTEGGTLVTEGIARTLAQEEIAKYDFIKIVEELPDEGLPNRIYLVPHEAEEGSNDLFDMWLWVNDAWEFEGTKSAEIDNTLYVKFTDYASGGKAGVVKTQAYLGVNTNPASGNLEIKAAEPKEILDKTNAYKPIVSTTNDYAVKVGITTSTETWTDEDKAAACKTIGAFPNVLTSLAGDGYIPFYNPNTEEYGYKRAYGSFIGKNAVVMRDENGDIRGKTPTAESAVTVLVNKEYVDNGFVAKSTQTGGQYVYGIDSTAKPVMYKVAAGENTFTRGGFPISASYGAIFQSGVISENDPNYRKYTINRGFFDDNKGTKLYKHTISGFVGGTGVIDIPSITLISTSNAQITSASDLDLHYTQYVVTANTAYGKVVNIVQTMTNEITMQFHSRPAGGEVETVVLDASNITDTVTEL